MINYKTLAFYLIRLFLKQFFIVSTIVIAIFFVTNAFDILQNFKSVNISLSNFWMLISFKIPFLFYEVITIIAFIASLMFLQNIAKHNELIILLSSGISIWRIFIVPATLAFLIGLISLLIVSPVATYGLQKYEALEAKLNNKSHLNVTISQSGIFLFENFDQNNRIIHAKSINASQKTLYDLTVLELDSDNNLIKRIHSPVSTLEPGSLKLTNVQINSQASTEFLNHLDIPTNLTINNLIQRFSPPEMISIWNLNNAIKKFSKSGLAVHKYELFYYKQIFKPLTMVVMSLIACWFINPNAKNQLSWKIITFGCILGICIYFALEITVRILGYNGVSPLLATLCPILLALLISNFVILHFQES